MRKKTSEKDQRFRELDDFFQSEKIVGKSFRSQFFLPLLALNVAAGFVELIPNGHGASMNIALGGLSIACYLIWYQGKLSRMFYSNCGVLKESESPWLFRFSQFIFVAVGLLCLTGNILW